MIVVAQDREGAVAGVGAQEPQGQRAYGRRIEVDEVSGGHDEIGANAGHQLEPLVELAVADERPHVDVRDLRDRVPLESARPVLHADDDLLEREGVAAADHAPAERGGGRSEDRHAGHAFDRLTA